MIETLLKKNYIKIPDKPVFDGEPSSGVRQVLVTEGEQGHLSFSPRGNPPDLKLTWTKNNHSYKPPTRAILEGASLNLSTVRREDAGFYGLEASNEEGSTKAKLQLVVKFAPKITVLTRVVMADDKGDATLSCTAVAEPLAQEHFTWKRAGVVLKDKVTISYANGTSTLRIHDPTKADMGPYECVVNNKIGAIAKGNSTLLIKHKPEFDLSPEISKSASVAGNEARLTCRATGAPEVNFNWSKENYKFTSNTSDRYFTAIKKVWAFI